MMAELTVAWMLLEGAVIAHEKAQKLQGGAAAAHPDAAFYDGKVKAALYYARNVLPGVEDKARIMADEDQTALDIAEGAFATV